MADNVTILSSGSTSIAADDVSSVFYQKVKLDGCGDGSTAPITGDTANGLDVDVTRLPALVAGTANIGDVDVLTLPALPAGTNNIGDVDVLTLPNVTIGTMAALVAGTANIGDVDVLTLPAIPTGTNVIGYTREYRSRTRQNVTLYLEAYTLTAADFLITVQRSINYVAPTGASSHSVTASKIWRFHTLVLTYACTSATISSATVRIRANTAGAAVVGSPIAFTARIGPGAGTLAAQQCYTSEIPLPEGLEFAASTGIGFTAIGSAAQGAVSATLIGFEYDV